MGESLGKVARESERKGIYGRDKKKLVGQWSGAKDGEKEKSLDQLKKNSELVSGESPFEKIKEEMIHTGKGSLGHESKTERKGNERQ